MFIIMEVISRAVESKVFKEYIEELTRAEQTTREIRKAIVNVASLGSCVYHSRRATWGMDEGVILGVSPLILCVTSSRSMKSIPVLLTHHLKQSGK